jgi:hypothetical protein
MASKPRKKQRKGCEMIPTTNNKGTVGAVPLAAAHSTFFVSDSTLIKLMRKGTKREKVLRMLVERGAQGLNCFEAVQLCGDYVLRTTISDLQKELGITISRKPETIANQYNTHCVRYWLEPDQRQKAAAMLGMEGEQ